MSRTIRNTLMRSALGVGMTVVAGVAVAHPPVPQVLCHNIGGPRDLGANCDGTGNCSYQLGDGTTMVVAPDFFLGIVIGTDSPQAIAAHLAHGDGYATALYDPPLHLASVIGPHRASNVECLARRAITTQPPEPVN